MQVLKLLEKFDDLVWVNKPINDLNLTSLEWKVQDSTNSSILFLKNTKNIEVKKLISSLSLNSVGLVITDSSEISSLLKNEIPCCLVENKQWIDLQFNLSNIYYPIPKGVKFAAVTGTNGKTSTINFLSQLLFLNNHNCLSLGTLGIFYNTKKVNDVGLTSPSYIDFRKTIFNYAKVNDVIAFEMSSHALDQQRFYKVSLAVAGWTSFSQDHLDYHKTMESYFEAKKLILNYLEESAELYVPYGQLEIFNKIKHDQRVKLCRAWDEYNFKNPTSLFNASFAKDNFILACEMKKKLISENLIKPFDLNQITNVPGRWMLKSFAQKTIIIDYAHTPDALVNVCQNAKDAFPNTKLKVLFGCGGDRDKSKRPLMAQAVSRFADYIYVTSDNPRTEDAESIIDDIIPGISKKYFRHADRKETLVKALGELDKNEVLIVAGKGHENYIIKGTTKYPYSDEQVCDEFISKKVV